MLSLRPYALMVVLLGAACADEATRPDAVLPPASQGAIDAYVSVDNMHAQVGQTVRVSVLVQVGPDTKVGSYTGRLRFNPSQLALKGEVPVNDGLRVSNPRGAGLGELRFAGASAAGFAVGTLYQADFTVRNAAYASTLALQMEELSAAQSLSNLAPRMRVVPQVQLAPAGQQ